jgi:predicted small secreted protein
MRAARYLIPLAVVAALVAGCNSKSGNGGTVTPTTPAVLADNGIASLPVQQILEKALAALKAAKSVHIKGDIKTGDGLISIDLTLTDTKDGVGTMSMSGQTVQLTKVGTDVYMKADAGFWKQFAGDQGGVIATLLAGKYLKASTTDAQFGSMASFFDFAESLDMQGEGTVGETKAINGINAVSVKEKSAESPGTLWIATQGEPYPLRLEGPPGEGQIDFTDYNKPVDIKAPPADQVIDVAKLKGN